MNNIQEIKDKYIEEITLDKPININGLSILPVQVRDYYSFVLYVDVLNLNKNKINDPKIISMSYMQFLIHIILHGEENERNFIYISLQGIFNLVIGKEVQLDIALDKNNKPCFVIDGIMIDKSSFDLIRKIILIQNIPNYKEEHLDPYLEEDLKKVQELRNHGSKSVDMEHKIAFLQMASGISLNDIYSMPIRKFIIMLEMESKYTFYKIFKQAEMSGMVEFKQDIPYYLDETVTTVGIDYDSFKNKINSAN